MSLRKSKAAVLASILLVLFVVVGCSEDETTPEPSDTTPPTITGHYPLDGATDASRSGPYWVAFSEPMDEESVENTLYFDLVPPDFDLSWNGDTLFITPYYFLPGDESYTITIDGDCEDLHGNKLGSDYPIEFTTTTEDDTTPPYVVSTVPADNATNVNSGMPIEIVFSEPMNQNATEGAIDIDPEPEDSGAEWESTTLIIYHTPFPQDVIITITIGTGAADLAGNPLSAVYEFDYRTAIDDVRPYLASASPSNGATNVSTGLDQMVLTFSETMASYSFDMPPENVDARINQAVDQAAMGDDPWNDTYTTLTVPLRSDRDLLQGCTYWAKFQDVTDAAGNPIDPNPTNYAFTTQGTPTRFVYESGVIWFVHTETYEEKTHTIENYNPGSGTFDIFFRDSGGINDVWHMRKTGTEIQHLGRDEYDDGVYQFTMTWDTPLPYIKLPIANYLGDTWYFATGATLDEHYSIEISGRVEIEPYPVNLVSEILYGTFDGCYVHHLYVTTTFYEDGIPVDEGSLHHKTWLSEGVGWVMIVNEEDGDPPDTLVVFDWDI